MDWKRGTRRDTSWHRIPCLALMSPSYLRSISGTIDEAGPSPSGKLMKVFKVTRKHSISVLPLPLVRYFQMLLNVLECTGKHVLCLKENKGQRDM